MKNFCTLSDYNYLPLGLSLYESLKKTTKGGFNLYYLCLDDKTFDTLENIEGIIPVNIKKLLEDNKDLSEYKQVEYREFVWMLASYFTYYIMVTKQPNNISYIDADICLYDDIQTMYDEIGDRSVGIIRHRHIPETMNTADGKYNVGIVYFKNDIVGRHCLDWWHDAVLYKKYPQLATCYDQKYLEGFLQMYPNDKICVADSFGHGAPWHHRLYDWSQLDIDNTILWEGKRQKFLFNHFSRISFNVSEDTYEPSGGQYSDHTLNFSVFEIPQVRKMHDEYFQLIKNTTKKYEL